MSRSKPLSPRLTAVMARMEARIDWEKRRRRDAMRVDTSPARDLLDRAGSPDRGLRLIHVGGTKGKGSTAIRIAEGLSRAGLRAGVYGSPHVERVTERVRLGREEIGDEALAAGLERALELQAEAEAAGSPGGTASWFDLMTVAAMICMRDAGMGWAVLEVGLGGRLDSTNAMDGELSVVTSIDLEHTEILGSTRSAIAAEKAGILRRGQPFVCGVAPDVELALEEDAGAALLARAGDLGCPTVLVLPRASLADTNQALAGAALGILGRGGLEDPEGRPLGPWLLETGDPWGLPGRMERRTLGGISVILDGAHVASSLARVLDELTQDPLCNGPCMGVLAVALDKPTESILKTLVGRVDTVFCTSVASDLHRVPETLAASAREVGLEAVASRDPGSAITEACARASPGGWVLVTGSLYLIGAVRSVLEVQANPS